MIEQKQAAADAFGFLFGLAVAGGAVAGHAVPHITFVGSLYGAFGGAMGGFLLVHAVKHMTATQRGLSIILSAVIGFAFAPIVTIIVGQQTGIIDPMDWFARVPIGFAFGAIMPWIYKLFTRLIQYAEDNPAQAIEDIKNAIPKITIGGKDDD